MSVRGRTNGWIKIPLAAAAGLAVILFTGLVFGGEPNWSPEWDSGIEEAKERNCPIVLVAPFKRGTFAPSQFPESFRDKQVLKFADRFVCFYAESERFPKVDTVYAAKYVKPDSGKYGSQQVIFCKPDGTEIEKMRIFPGVTPAKIVQNMIVILKSYPNSISKMEYESCKAFSDRAEMLRKLGAYADAIKAYEELSKKKSKLESVKKAKDKPQELIKEAAAMVEEIAKVITGGKPEEKRDALKKLHVYSYGMKKMDVHKKVRELLNTAKKDKDLVQDYGRAMKNAKAFDQFVKAELAYFEEDYKSAMKSYRRITRTYDETDYYDRAKERIQEIIKKLTPEKKSTTP